MRITRFFYTLLLWLVTLNVLAIPAKPQRIQLELQNGTLVWAILTGDEFAHWYEGEDGQQYQLGEDGKAVLLSHEEVGRLQINRTQKMQAANARRNAAMNQLRLNAPQKAPLFSGSKKGLVILVNFADKKLSSKGTQAEFNNMFNKSGYSSNNHVGSVHDYFLDNSYGQFNLTFDVVGPVTVSQNMSYYGQNDRNGSDMYPATMVIEACKLADRYVNFSNYDWNKDGYVDQVFVVYAGYGEHAGAPSNTIWPHEYNLYSANYFGDGTGVLTLDGVKINTYAVTSELIGYSGTTLAGIGTACHEFCHCLTLPDTYDTDYSGGKGLMSWGLMCSGSYNGYSQNGERPVALTAFERFMLGWLDPVELTSPTYITDMPAISDSPMAYIVYKTDTELYMLENRQKGKWDYYSGSRFMGHGLLITHIDYDRTAWAYNRVNDDPSHQRFTFIPADNAYDSNVEGDTYPGSSNNTKLTDTSTPYAMTYSGGRMGKSITDIVEKNGKISFSFMGGTEEGGGSEPASLAITIPSSVTLAVGASEQMKPVITPSGSTPLLTWHSTDPEIAEFFSTGWLRGKAEGTTIVYCETSNGTRSNFCTVTVTALIPESISLTPSYIYLPMGQSKQMEYHLQPWNAVTTISWNTKSASEIVTLSNDGLLTAIAPGSGIIEVRTSNGKYAECEVCVPPDVASISLPQKSMVAKGQSVPLALKVDPEDAWYEITWATENANIVSVTQQGRIIGISEGSCRVTATTQNGKVAETQVSVYAPSFYFLVIFKEGNNLRFEIQEEPTISYEGSNLVLTSKAERREFPLVSVRKMQIVDRGIIASLGDINGDGEVNITDMAHLIQLLIDGHSHDADVNFDGILNSRDIEELVNIILSENK